MHLIIEIMCPFLIDALCLFHAYLNKGMGKIKNIIFGVQIIVENFVSLDMRC